MQSFRSNTTVMIGLAVLFGGAAVFLARAWLEHQADLNASRSTVSAPVNQTTLVVAAEPLRFGNELEAAKLAEIPWPSDALPDGAYAKIDDVMKDGRRVVVRAMEKNEPVLISKITGSGERAGLASLVTEGERAVTMRVNDVNGVAGFVLPGDRVDILMSQYEGKDSNASDVVLQNVKVLAIDQIADDKSDQPNIVKAVTIETNIAGAQKVTLASLAGTLSFTLRRAGDISIANARRITLTDLTRQDTPTSAPGLASFMMSAEKSKSASQDITVRVTLGAAKKEYVVPRE
ncbi:MAG: Flp pilus assembly protein CpaB [Pseudomonadota bacterium]